MTETRFNTPFGSYQLRRNPRARIYCVDESHMAVASARATLETAFGPEVRAEFHAAWNLDLFSSGSMDQDARRVLGEGGELWVVGNRHLGYHQTLKRLFGKAELIASNPTFVVLRCLKG